MSLVVLEAGLASRVVDAGRPNWRSLGVPLGGAADRASLALGNALVGNVPDAAALEVCLRGPTLRAEVDVGCVVWGAPFDMAVGPKPWRVGRSFTWKAGQEVHMGGTPRGMRAYLCVCGGLDTALVLGSRSALAPLKSGMVLPCRSGTAHERWIVPQEEFQPPHGAEQRLRVLPGLQMDWFAGAAFLGLEFVVTPALDRMGIRLQAEPLPFPARELLSEPVSPGTVQVTRDGQCIILGVDGQTIGGYPKIAQVISADLDRLGQLRPGDKIHFELVSLQQAEQAWRHRQDCLHEWVTRLQITFSG